MIKWASRGIAFLILWALVIWAAVRFFGSG